MSSLPLWRRLIARTARPPEGPRTAALRCVILEEGMASPSGDYLLCPWMERLGLPMVRVDLRAAPPRDLLRRGDLIVLSRYAPPAWRRVLQARRSDFAGLIYFMDDDLLDPAAHAGLSKSYVRKIDTLATSQKRWLQAHMDAFWVSTPALAAKYAALSPTLIPLAPPVSLRQGRPVVRVAYHGTASHGAEIDWLHEVVKQVQQRCDTTRFELFGEHAVQRRYRDLPRVAVLHPMRWENYLAHTCTERADIGLAPLLPSAFNAARGAVKFFDYGRMGAFGLYSDVAPYRGFVRDGVDGLLLPNEPRQWADTLVALAGDTARRSALQAAVRERLAPAEAE